MEEEEVGEEEEEEEDDDDDDDEKGCGEASGRPRGKAAGRPREAAGWPRGEAAGRPRGAAGKPRGGRGAAGGRRPRGEAAGRGRGGTAGGPWFSKVFGDFRGFSGIFGGPWESPEAPGDSPEVPRGSRRFSFFRRFFVVVVGGVGKNTRTKKYARGTDVRAMMSCHIVLQLLTPREFPPAHPKTATFAKCTSYRELSVCALCLSTGGRRERRLRRRARGRR